MKPIKHDFWRKVKGCFDEDKKLESLKKDTCFMVEIERNGFTSLKSFIYIEWEREKKFPGGYLRLTSISFRDISFVPFALRVGVGVFVWIKRERRWPICYDVILPGLLIILNVYQEASSLLEFKVLREKFTRLRWWKVKFSLKPSLPPSLWP